MYLTYKNRLVLSWKDYLELTYFERSKFLEYVKFQVAAEQDDINNLKKSKS